MRRSMMAAAALALVANACVGGGSDERTVFVDYSHDEFSSIMVDYFPSEVTIAAGQTVVFKQIWTGEPHTVTGGTAVNDVMARGEPLIRFFDAFEDLAGEGVVTDPFEQPDVPLAQVFKDVEKADDPSRSAFLDAYDDLVSGGSKLPPRDDPGGMTFGKAAEIIDSEAEFDSKYGPMPEAWTEDDNGASIPQNGGQPCFLSKGVPPTDPDEPCSKSQQRQPEFDGTQTFYSSGIVPYEGPQGNTFRVPFAQDTKPGTYYFQCLVHGPQQSTKVTVKAAGTEVPSAQTVSRLARKEIADFAKPMLKVFRDAQDGKVDLDGQTVRAPFAGLAAPVFGAIDEFLPKQIHAKVGAPVTWTMMGWPHSISFDVPAYFPVVRFAKNGKVTFNKDLDKQFGGAPEPPEQEEGTPLKIDGGTYDGSGFWSSGLIAAEPYAEYTLRFSKPGTYKYACLLHPPMVGTVEVT